MNANIFNNLNQSQHLAKSIAFQLDKVSVRYGATLALNSIDLTVPKGEVLFVTGKSGAGKSTLLNILAQDTVATSGRVTHFDHHQAQVFQDLRLLNDLSLRENILISFDSTLYRSKKEFLSDMNELTRFLGIDSRLDLRCEKANGGLKQKVALVRALLTKPEILLCDEPTSSCDKESSIKFFELLNFYNTKKGLTVIWATHNKELVKQFPGKILHLDNGKLVYSGHACFI